MPRSRAPALLAKAGEFAASARDEFEVGRHNASALAAIHAGISAADAVTVHTGGVVSTGPSHATVIHVLEQCLPGGPPAAAERQLLGILRMKNDIEYTERAIERSQARVLVDQAERFVRWSRSLIEESG